MSVHIGSGLATGGDARGSAVEAALEARAGLGGAPADLAVVFVAGAHVAAAGAVLEGVHEALAPGGLVGCGAGGVLGGRREIETGTAVAVWAAALGDGSAATFHAEAEQLEEGVAVHGFPDLAGATGAVLIPDPFTFPTDAILRELARHAPGVPVIGGIASAQAPGAGGALLLHGEDVLAGGAVGVRLDGVELLPCVSQGAAPVGPELTITAAEGQVIAELAGRPALEKLRDVIRDLPVHQRELVARGPLLGVVIDGGKPEYVQGDFLVRGLVGADPEQGTIAVGALVEPGQVVRLHARDADSADRDLREALGLRREALGGAAPAGALVFTCNGRGRSMFGTSDHDAEAIGDELGDVPQAGFFAAGEIGPVGGETFLHGFTATVGVFAR
ncbi:MAG TPA: FIST C-terminal domain-containing protein [Solirubrobacteraceae bacterium]|jgi:small ligand-binding sensory domain FIST|nr:FIST C-terminal domain-containing protein [Solirubrobacteraceae bacterium]